MEPQRLEVESEAWYRAIAEGRLAPVSDPGDLPRYGRLDGARPRNGIDPPRTTRWTDPVIFGRPFRER